jgi:hypothetical protein
MKEFIKDYLPLVLTFAATFGAGGWWKDYRNRRKEKEEATSVALSNEEKLKKLKQAELDDLLQTVEQYGAKLLQHEGKLSSVHLLLAEKQKEFVRITNENADLKRELVIANIKITKFQDLLKRKV